MTASPYLLVEGVCERYHVRPRTVHDWISDDAIPHRKLPGSRRLLFLPAHLDAWDNGVGLERVDLPRGGRIVRPKEVATNGRR